ncbi:MAG: type II toxin-antitoxin system VapC family toxin [Acidobacteria bacterium]|nr:type II toxin-antitoxin system VapC family toxin [Acidobacteriota bacterium]
MVLVDANVLLDIITSDPKWFEWSADRMERALAQGLAINPVIYAELSAGFRKEEELDAALGLAELERLPIPYQAAFRAARAFVEYRSRGGDRRSPLPDFFIGAHAETAGLTLLTRDAARYRTYFPKLRLITPE